VRNDLLFKSSLSYNQPASEPLFKLTLNDFGHCEGDIRLPVAKLHLSF